jgi:DNA-binding beta-propeller fold protein YncE
MFFTTHWFWLAVWLRFIAIISAIAAMPVGPRQHGGVLVTTNQLLRPAGARTTFSGSPVDIAVSPDGETVAVSVANTVRIYAASGALQRTVQLRAGATFGGLAFSADGQKLAVSHGSGVTIVGPAASGPVTTIPIADPVPCGLAFDPARPFLYVALNTRNQVARIDLNQLRVTDTLSVGIAPVGIAVTPSGGRLFVSDWAGRPPRAGDLSSLSSGSQVVVDSRGITSSGAVSAIDLDRFVFLKHIEVGLHPAGIQASPDGRTVAVANANSDSVSFIDPSSLNVVSIAEVAAFPRDFRGSSPTALAFNADASRLYVTCGGNNSVATLERHSGIYESIATAPTDWYPVAVAVASRAGQDTVFVANAKGVGSRDGKAPYSVLSRLGTISRLQPADLVDSGQTPFLNAPFAGAPIPAGSPSDLGGLGIRHVFFIIKENRTYDQILGDLGFGNGDPKLAMYGWRVSPNHHALASQFVTLDNFYATGVVSADGHQWITQAMATDYIERSYSAGWPRSYPYSGEDPMAFAPTGFIWDNALRNGLSVRIFGEFTVAAASYSRSWTDYLLDAQSAQMRYTAPSRASVASTAGIVERDYPTFAMNVPDQFRARIFLDKFRQYVAQGDLPNLVIIWLPADHTAGVSPNTPSPASMVADNDLALGSIVETISKSPYWSSSAVFVTEDDAQNGVDHVDGHRTICLVASPYARRGAVDSTNYNQTSIVRTIEDLLGLPPMNKFDAAALPMRSVFTTTPDFSPYYASTNLVPLAQMNPGPNVLKGRQRKDALASLKMNFSIPDAAPEQTLNRVLWRSARGSGKPYPKIPHRPDCQVDDDDEHKPGPMK